MIGVGTRIQNVVKKTSTLLLALQGFREAATEKTTELRQP
jgi:hypothetical protein